MTRFAGASSGCQNMSSASSFTVDPTTSTTSSARRSSFGSSSSCCPNDHATATSTCVEGDRVNDTLLAQVYAEPGSDDPRIVLADRLMADGDPRGEMIAKQLAGDDAGAEPMIQQHGADWLGSLRPFANRAQFRRGFPARLELAEITRPGRIDLDALAADPALGTVEELLIGRAHHDVYGRLIASPAMTALRRIEITDEQVLIALRKSRAHIAHIAYAVPWLRRRHSGDPDALRDLLKRRFAIASLAV